MKLNPVILSIIFVWIQHAKSQQICSGRTSLLVEDISQDEHRYYLAFADEFDGPSIDTSLWTPSFGVMRHVETTGYWLKPDNLSINNGILFIRAQRDTFINQCFDIWIDTAMRKFCKNFFFSAGEIRTKTGFTHGIFEIRCKLPRANGIGTAFWAFGPDHNEIDVFEVNNEYNLLGKLKEKKLSSVQRTNIRTDYENDKIIEDCSAKSLTKDFHSDFHVFSVEWTPQKIVWRVDGEIVRITTLFYSIEGKMLDHGIKANTMVIVNKAFPRNPMEIYVSLGVDSGKNADAGATLPVFFEVDYVRYYKKL